MAMQAVSGAKMEEENLNKIAWCSDRSSKRGFRQCRLRGLENVVWE